MFYGVAPAETTPIICIGLFDCKFILLFKEEMSFKNKKKSTTSLLLSRSIRPSVLSTSFLFDSESAVSNEGEQ